MTGKVNQGATAVERSQNGKLGAGRVSATSVAQQSCPGSSPDDAVACPFYGKGCYAEAGPQGWTTARLNKAKLSRRELAEQEAAAIGKLSGKRPLRLHVVGDCSDNESARIVSDAAVRYRAKHGQSVWSYTHAWRWVNRANWQSVSILASCETVGECHEANLSGYAAAIVVERYESDTRYKMTDSEGRSVDVLPCPQITGRAASCADCGLCFKDRFLWENGLVIGFAAHNVEKEKVEQVRRTVQAKRNGTDNPFQVINK